MRYLLGPVLTLAVLFASVSCEERGTSVRTPSPQSSVVVLSDASFDADVLQSDTPVLVDFWATWCAPCTMVAPTVDELAAEYSGRIKVGKLDVDANARTAQRFNISAIPALLIFHKGQVKHRFIGVTSKQDLAQALDTTLKS